MVGKLGGVKLLGIFVVILQKAIKKTQENMSYLVADGNGIVSVACKYHVHSIDMIMHYFLDLFLWSSNTRHQFIAYNLL